MWTCKLRPVKLRPVLLYGYEMRALTRKEEKVSNTTEMRMLRWIMGVTMRDIERNDDVRKEQQGRSQRRGDSDGWDTYRELMMELMEKT